MQIRELSIPHARLIVPRQHVDPRGAFLEFYRFDRLTEAVGHPLELRQGNLSVSRKGVLRGIHFAAVPRGQAKYVSVAHGAVIDYVVDVRVGSPTFGKWEAVRLDDVDRHSLYLAEGLGHGFVALEEGTVLNYLVSDVFQPDREFSVSPLDSAIGLQLPDGIGEPIVSERDLAAPTLDEAAAAGILPTWDECLAYYAELDGSIE